MVPLWRLKSSTICFNGGCRRCGNIQKLAVKTHSSSFLFVGIETRNLMTSTTVVLRVHSTDLINQLLTLT